MLRNIIFTFHESFNFRVWQSMWNCERENRKYSEVINIEVPCCVVLMFSGQSWLELIH